MATEAQIYTIVAINNTAPPGLNRLNTKYEIPDANYSPFTHRGTRDQRRLSADLSIVALAKVEASAEAEATNSPLLSLTHQPPYLKPPYLQPLYLQHPYTHTLPLLPLPLLSPLLPLPPIPSQQRPIMLFLAYLNTIQVSSDKRSKINQNKQFMQNKPNLLDAQMIVSSVLTKYYENEIDLRLRRNKPNQTLFYPP